ncbi:VOC family protein [Rossellomorea aquimaris]|uniref:VOC family protein n=1 Tax=Rossellomorea aquimaris TaxID=189382 RepID=UPI0007D0AC41|nr:VOC family protein [Rossellomorea aquimaris]
MNIKGFNHLTINCRSLEESLNFYRDILGADLVHKGNKDAYVEWGSIWICLLEKEQMPSTLKGLGVDHIAFTISEEDFHMAVETLKSKRVKIVRGPVKRGRGWTINFLAPDGVQFELHTSNLKERMEIWT